MQELIEWAKKSFDYHNDPFTHAMVTKMEHLEKEKEKQQIIDARDYGMISSDPNIAFMAGEDYYNLTYKKQECDGKCDILKTACEKCYGEYLAWKQLKLTDNGKSNTKQL